MSRSRRRTPIFGITTAVSEKQDKRRANRVLRKSVGLALAAGEELLPVLRETSDVWLFQKDGKRFWRGGCAAAQMRK